MVVLYNMDFVEFILALENAFIVTISDSDAEIIMGGTIDTLINIFGKYGINFR